MLVGLVFRNEQFVLEPDRQHQQILNANELALKNAREADSLPHQSSPENPFSKHARPLGARLQSS